MSDPPTVHRATDEFVAFLLATRDGWREAEVRQAIGAATNLGRSWAFVTTGLQRIAFDGGQPLDLCPVPTGQASAAASAGPNREYLDTRATLEGRHAPKDPS